MDPNFDQLVIFSPLGGTEDPISGFTDRYDEYLQLQRGDFEKIDF